MLERLVREKVVVKTEKCVSVTADVCLDSSPLNVRDREVCGTILYFANLQKEVL